MTEDFSNIAHIYSVQLGRIHCGFLRLLVLCTHCINRTQGPVEPKQTHVAGDPQ